MKIAEYREALDQIERGDIRGTAEALWLRLHAIGRELSTALWRPPFDSEATALAGRAKELEERLWATDLVSSYRQEVRTYAGHLEAGRVADPSYIPTVDEALRHPAEFVDGMEEI